MFFSQRSNERVFFSRRLPKWVFLHSVLMNEFFFHGVYRNGLAFTSTGDILRLIPNLGLEEWLLLDALLADVCYL